MSATPPFPGRKPTCASLCLIISGDAKLTQLFETSNDLLPNRDSHSSRTSTMLDKYVWRVLFLALLATASLALTSPGPSCHDGVGRTNSPSQPALGIWAGSSVIFANDTTYERLDCLGFNPDLNLLSATIEVKLPTGFSGGLAPKAPSNTYAFGSIMVADGPISD
jgi:hypothetical protein